MLIFLQITSEVFMVIAIVGMLLVTIVNNHLSQKRTEKVFRLEMQRREAEWEHQRKLLEEQVRWSQTLENQRHENTKERQVFRFWEILIMLIVAIIGLIFGLN